MKTAFSVCVHCGGVVEEGGQESKCLPLTDLCAQAEPLKRRGILIMRREKEIEIKVLASGNSKDKNSNFPFQKQGLCLHLFRRQSLHC